MAAAARIIGQNSSDSDQSTVYIDGNGFSVSRTQRRDSAAHLQLRAQSLQMNLNLRWRLQEVA